MRLPERFLAFGMAVTAGHATVAGYGLVGLHSPEFAMFFAVCALLTAVFTTISYRLLRRHRGDDGDSGGGGGGPDDEPPPPPWWPGFERDFWSHVERDRGPSRPNVPV